jgi:hypothetical protein
MADFPGQSQSWQLEQGRSAADQSALPVTQNRVITITGKPAFQINVGGQSIAAETLVSITLRSIVPRIRIRMPIPRPFAEGARRDDGRGYRRADSPGETFVVSPQHSSRSSHAVSSFCGRSRPTPRRFASLVGTDAFAGALTRGSIGTIPETEGAGYTCGIHSSRNDHVLALALGTKTARVKGKGHGSTPF